MFIDSAHVFSANLYAELRQKHLKYDSIPRLFDEVQVKNLPKRRAEKDTEQDLKYEDYIERPAIKSQYPK